MDDLTQGVQEAERQLAEMQLAVQLERNLLFFRSVAPNLVADFVDYTPTRVRMDFGVTGTLNLIDCSEGRPIYPKDPATHARAQVAQYVANPLCFAGSNKTTTVIDEEQNAHISNANAIVGLLGEHAQERPATLPASVDFMLMLGLGMGHQIEALLEHSDIQHLCVVEPEPDLFYASLHTLDWAPLVERFSRDGRSLEMIIGADVEACAGQLDDYVADIGGFHVVHPYLYEHLSSRTLAESFKAFVERVVPKHIRALGYFDDERVGLAHTMRNHGEGSPLLMRRRDTGAPRVELPVFVVANGPSLDIAIDFLVKNKDRAIVISCGTALGSLAKAGIRPDFHVEMERSRPVVEWIESATTAEDRAGTTLLALNTVHPDVYDLFTHTGMALKSNDAGATYLLQHGNGSRSAVEVEDCNPTVANAAMSIVAELGLADVYLFGLDLGFPSGAQHHASLSKYYDVKESEVGTLGLYRHDSDHNVTEPGNFGGEVVTTLVYRAARDAIQRVLAANPQMTCRNASTGIGIDGARAIAVADIRIARRAAEKATIVTDIFRRHFGDAGIDPVTEDDLSAVTEATRTLLRSLHDIAREPAGSRMEALALLSDLHAAITTERESAGERQAAALLKGSVGSFCVLLAQAVHRHVDDAEAVALFMRCRERFIAFVEGATALTDEGLFEVDTRTRNLADKLLVTA